MKQSIMHKGPWVERVAQKAAVQMESRLDVDEIALLKFKLGIETLLINVSKMVVVYVLAAVFHLFWEVLLFNMSYAFIRMKAYGFHAQSSIVCTAASTLVFVGVPYMCTTVVLPPSVLLLLFGLNGALLFLYAPAGTKKNKIRDESSRRRLRNKALAANIALLAVTMVMPVPEWQALITCGAVLAGFMVMPITYKIFSRGAIT